MPEFTHSNSVAKFGERPPRTRLTSSSSLHVGDPTELHTVPAPTRRQEATLTLDELRGVLTARGIIFPSLELDIVSLSSTYMRPLIELGRVNLETARLLTRVLGETDPR